MAAGYSFKQSRLEKLLRMIRSARRGITPIASAMSSPPTVTIGTALANSTINAATAAFGQGMYQANDLTVLEHVGGKFGLDPATSNRYSPQGRTSDYTTGAKGGCPGNGIRFATDATSLDFCINIGPFIIYVTDPLTGLRQRHAANDDATALTNFTYIKAVFADASVKIVEIFVSEITSWRGINVNTGAQIWRAPVVDEFKFLLFGDSYVFKAGSGATNGLKLAYPDYLGERLGVPNVFCSGRSSTGFLNQGSPSTYGTFIQRITAGDLDISQVGAMDAIFIHGSVNDDVGVNAAYTDVAIQAAVQATFELAMVKQPDAIIFGTGPESTTNRVATQSRWDAMKAGFVAAAKGDPRMIWLDGGPNAENWMAGKVARIIGVDNTHPNNAGHEYLGRREGDSMINAVLNLLAA